MDGLGCGDMGRVPGPRVLPRVKERSAGKPGGGTVKGAAVSPASHFNAN